MVHVAGTNGKGSTSAMVASILKLEGYRVGLYTSPHGGILRVDLEHENGSDLEFTLTTPDGFDIDITMDNNQLIYGTRITPHPPTDELVNGVWTLTIKDTTEGNTGFLRGWSLYLESWPD